MADLGRKRLLAEVDVFQVEPTDELYSHMNVNYVKLRRVPTFDHYDHMLYAMRKGEFFVSTGEVLLPDVRITSVNEEVIQVTARVENTFPLPLAATPNSPIVAGVKIPQ